MIKFELILALMTFRKPAPCTLVSVGFCLVYRGQFCYFFYVDCYIGHRSRVLHNENNLGLTHSVFQCRLYFMF